MLMLNLLPIITGIYTYCRRFSINISCAKLDNTISTACNSPRSIGLDLDAIAVAGDGDVITNNCTAIFIPDKKALRMAVTLAIINMPLLAQAADVSPVRITDGST